MHGRHVRFCVLAVAPFDTSCKRFLNIMHDEKLE